MNHRVECFKDNCRVCQDLLMEAEDEKIYCDLVDFINRLEDEALRRVMDGDDRE
ncbi:hypothetical protein [Hydrogenophaga sp. NH-16]|uniref:hypothetical protein n=1 Tax=Hydrogenophaga sp. NH-16 TaxID=2184519 RepID=UPI0013E3BFF2|nr:hypothetical protein [Hydrogenophaga sp. NH-16]